MRTHAIASLHDPRIADFRNVPDADLLRRRGLFIAEGRLVVRRLLTDSAYRTRSVLVTDAALVSLREAIDGRVDEVYVASPALMREIVGFDMHRGCLAVGERPAPVAWRGLVSPPDRRAALVVLEGVGNADNVGGVFRNALAFGADAVLLGPGCCDPLYRKAVRVSAGGALRVPFASMAPWPDSLGELREHGVRVVALTPSAEAVDIRRLDTRPLVRVALVVGAEGSGLTGAALRQADICVRIPMAPGVDSLNLSSAAAIALHSLGIVPT